jgi:hypothetical protein
VFYRQSHRLVAVLVITVQGLLVLVVRVVALWVAVTEYLEVVRLEQRIRVTRVLMRGVALAKELVVVVVRVALAVNPMVVLVLVLRLLVLLHIVLVVVVEAAPHLVAAVTVAVAQVVTGQVEPLEQQTRVAAVVALLLAILVVRGVRVLSSSVTQTAKKTSPPSGLDSPTPRTLRADTRFTRLPLGLVRLPSNYGSLRFP